MDGHSESEPTDAEAIRASLDDPGAFAALFDRHASVVFRFLVRRVGRDTADELLAETFRIAFEKRAGFDCNQPTARNWLYGIANNLISRHYRAEARRLRALARVAMTRSPAMAIQDLPEVVHMQDLWSDVVHAIVELPDGERDALLLYAWEALTYEEIAVAINIPVGTVRSRLSRARHRLRERMAATSTALDALLAEGAR